MRIACVFRQQHVLEWGTDIAVIVQQRHEQYMSLNVRLPSTKAIHGDQNQKLASNAKCLGTVSYLSILHTWLACTYGIGNDVLHASSPTFDQQSEDLFQCDHHETL